MACCDCSGTIINIDKISIVNNNIKEINARPGSVGIDKILVRLIETPTNINPVKVAAAPAVAKKKSCPLVNIHNYIFQ